MIDFKLTDNTGDLNLSTGDLVLVDGVGLIAQLIGTRFRFQRGEWFLDTRVGAPLFDDGSGIGFIMGAKRSDLEAIRAICTEIIEGAPGVKRLASLDIALDGNRALTVDWQVEGTTGEFVSGTETLIFGEL